MTTRKALTYVEVDITYCGLSYGVGACPAVLGVDSAVKCWNTLATCAVPASFDDSPVTLRFSKDHGYNPADIEALPFLNSVSISPARISLGEDLGQRESVTLTFGDAPHADTGRASTSTHRSAATTRSRRVRCGASSGRGIHT